MKIFHIIKKSGCDTDFRKIMLASLDRVQTLKTICKQKLEISIYIASGFFHTNVRSPKIDVLNFTDPKTKLTLSKLLLGLNVEILGAYSGPKDLVTLKSLLLPIVKSLNVYYKNRFHTKLFIITINDIPIFEMIGSSNMTVPAYEGLQYSTRGKSSPSLNTETDLVLYNDDVSFSGVSFNLSDIIVANENIINFSYDKKENKDISLDERMDTLIEYFNTLKSKMKKI